MRKLDNFGDLIKYIRKNILEPATEEVEADDFKIDFYNGELCFQINELYDGLKYVYYKDKDIIEVEIPERHYEPDVIHADELKQMIKMVQILDLNKKLLKEMC